MKYTWDKRKLLSYLSNENSRKDLFDLLKALKKDNSKTLDDFSNINHDIQVFRSMPQLAFYLKDMPEKTETYPKEKEMYSIDDALYLVNEYYKLYGDKIYEIFLSIFAQKDKNLKLASNIQSKTIVCPSSNDIFIQVNFDGSLHSVMDLVHEYSHAIGYRLCPYEQRTEVNDYFVEIESSFHTLLFLDFMDKLQIDPEEVQNERNSIMNYIISDTKFIKDKINFIDCYREYQKTSKNLNYKEFKEYTKMSDEEFDKLFYQSIDTILPYLIGNYIAIELYYKYKDDPTFGIFLYLVLSKVTAHSCENCFTQIEAMGINPGEHISQFSEELKTRV